MTPEPASGEDRITLGLLEAVHGDAAVSQRALAGQLGVALGRVNAHLQRCIGKGWIRASRAPGNRYAYELTQAGIAEKNRLTAGHLARALAFYREARSQLDGILADCARRGARRIALYGAGELAEIALISATQHEVEIAGVVDRDGARRAFLHTATVPDLAELGALDAVILTDLGRPQSTHDALAKDVAAEKLLVPALLRVSRSPPAEAAS